MDPFGESKKLLCKIGCSVLFALELIYCNLPFCPPDPECMSNAYTRWYVCFHACDLLSDKDDDDNDDNFYPPVPREKWPPPVPWGGPGHVVPPWGMNPPVFRIM